MMELGFWHMACALLVPGVLLAAWIDYSQRRVPNRLNLALIVTGFVVQGIYFGTAGLAIGFWGMLTGFGLLIVPWLMHGMGAGDVKLLAAIGVWLGPWPTVYAFAIGALLGGLAAMVMIIWSGRLWAAWMNMGAILTKCCSRATIFSEFASARSFGNSSQLLPYGVPLTVGTLAVLGAKAFGWGEI